MHWERNGMGRPWAQSLRSCWFPCESPSPGTARAQAVFLLAEVTCLSGLRCPINTTGALSRATFRALVRAWGVRWWSVASRNTVASGPWTEGRHSGSQPSFPFGRVARVTRLSRCDNSRATGAWTDLVSESRSLFPPAVLISGLPSLRCSRPRSG